MFDIALRVLWMMLSFKVGHTTPGSGPELCNAALYEFGREVPLKSNAGQSLTLEEDRLTQSSRLGTLRRTLEGGTQVSE